ncbi:MAG: M20/M25/M40 family metallo-hydrolase [Desulfobacteraceae bacterium]|nr:M20/M25/M40 family metallo-hydrolase [Desulfobacteraceae bacterium]
MINEKRLVNTFKELVQIDSVSRDEKAVCEHLQHIFRNFGASVTIDNAGEKAGSNTGNLICKLDGTINAPPLLLSAHMDTVDPGRGITPVEKDGRITSDGTTILGADDKSALAVIIEVLTCLLDKQLPRCPMEFVFTICEEVGLLGAKHLNYSLITAKSGYVLDAGDVENVINKAPGSNKIEFNIHGKAAHAGSAPEKGINAISIASKAIASLELGKIDDETTCNIGVIEGGSAINVIPNLVNVKGEIRSHNADKLERVTKRMTDAFVCTVAAYKKNDTDELPGLDVVKTADYTSTTLADDHPVITVAMQAAQNIGMKLGLKKAGGGSDANVFFGKDIIAAVLGTGMRDVHSVNESIAIKDMVKSAELLVELIRLHSTETT